ncbi:DNA gyrase subunit A, partial [Candidatus Gottesmanbacteria bacterium RBG_16_37_8]
ADLVKKIAELVHDKKVSGVSDLRDESDKDGLRVVVDLKRDARPKAVLNNIYKHTKLQTTFPANFVALVGGVPYTLSLKQILVEYIKHRQEVITRRTLFELADAKRRAHILEGLKIALDNLDEVIKTIRQSRTQDEAKINLISKFKFSGIQATAILDMQLRRLAALEREKIEKEYQELKKIIDSLIAILKNPEKILQIIIDELTKIKEKFGDNRRTKIYKREIEELSEEDLVPKKKTLITVTHTGYVKRVPVTTYKSQARGGKGVTGMTIKEEDEIEHLISATTHDTILFFTNQGKVYGTKAWDIPETTRQGRGQAVVNIIDINQDEKIMSILPMRNSAKHLIIATAAGAVKKTSIKEFQSMRSSGLIAIRLEGKDQLVSVHETTGDDNILVITKKGKTICFPEANVRPMGRATTGMKGIKLSLGDEVIGMEVFSKNKPKSNDKRRKIFRDILTISENGVGKRTPIHLFPVQKRAGSGVKIAVVSPKTGDLATEIILDEKVDQVVITSKNGQIIKLPIKNIPQMGRSTQGVILMRFTNKNDKVAAVAALKKEIEDSEAN